MQAGKKEAGLSARLGLPDFASAAEQICEAGRLLDAKNMAPATSGNYSMRLDDGAIALTVSGYHKGRLTPDMVMRIDADAQPLEDKKPSAEALLHAQLYALYPHVNAILHVHSMAGVVLGRVRSGDNITLAGYEMLKAFPGITTHETSIDIPVFENSQDMNALSANITQRGLQAHIPAYLIRDHGFYAWGRTMRETLTICEALEYLLMCEMHIQSIQNR